MLLHLDRKSEHTAASVKENKPLNSQAACKSSQQSGFIQQVLYFNWRAMSARNVEPTAVWMTSTE